MKIVAYQKSGGLLGSSGGQSYFTRGWRASGTEALVDDNGVQTSRSESVETGPRESVVVDRRTGFKAQVESVLYAPWYARV